MFEVQLQALALVAAFVQRLVAFVKPFYQSYEYQKHIDLGLSLVASIALCVNWGVDVFAAAGIHFGVEWLGAALTGAVASFGSSVLNDFLKLLEALKKPASTSLTVNVEQMEKPQG